MLLLTILNVILRLSIFYKHALVMLRLQNASNRAINGRIFQEREIYFLRVNDLFSRKIFNNNYYFNIIFLLRFIFNFPSFLFF